MVSGHLSFSCNFSEVMRQPQQLERAKFLWYHGKQMGKQWKQWKTLFSWAPKSLQMVTAAKKLKDASSLEEKLWET